MRESRARKQLFLEDIDSKIYHLHTINTPNSLLELSNLLEQREEIIREESERKRREAARKKRRYNEMKGNYYYVILIIYFKVYL